jgi:hypothetical protein
MSKCPRTACVRGCGVGLGYRLRMELTLNQRMAVTRVIAVRYRCAGKTEKGKILDELNQRGDAISDPWHRL